MKKVIAILMVVSLMVFMTVPTLAVNGPIGKYTPVLDGEKDEAYNQSLKFNIYADQDLDVGETFYCDSGDETNAGDVNLWLLYDDDFMYVFAEVKDNDIVDIGMDEFKDQTNPWQSDACELWFIFDDDSANFVKYSTIAYGLGSWGQEGFDFIMSGDEPAQNGYDAIVKMTPDGYNAEYKIPIKKYGIKEGGEIYFTVQHNNLRSDGSLVISGRQLQNSGDMDNAAVLKLGGEIIIETPVEPDEPDEPEPVDEPVQDTVVVTETAPKTGDISVFAILGMLVIGSVAVSVLKTGKKKI